MFALEVAILPEKLILLTFILASIFNPCLQKKFFLYKARQKN